MDNEIEIAKKNFKQRNGIKRATVKPIILKGTTFVSPTLFEVNGQRMVLFKSGINSEFIRR